MAAGCGDWDRLEAGWDLRRCRAMARHWTEVAPPAHVSLARLSGFRPSPGAPGGEAVADPQELDRQLRALGVLT